MKKFISFMLSLTLILSGLAIPVSSNESEEINVENEISVKGTNSFGEMVEDVVDETLEDQKENNGCNIFSVEVYGNEAVVNFETTVDATLVVAIYEESGVKMLGSGSIEVYAEEYDTYVDKTAYVYIDIDEMPQYFYLRAFLVNNEYAPICTAYSSPMYTKDMQDLLSKTVADFDSEKVLNLDTNEATNFAVFSNDVKIIPESSEFNSISSVDQETDTYIIENIDNNISNLLPGDTFAYHYDEEVLIVKIENITIDGEKATITGGDTSMEAVFDYVKIEGDPDTSTVTYDPTGIDEDMTFMGEVEECSTLSSRTSVDVSTTKTLSFGLDKEFEEGLGENIKFSGEAKGNIELKLTGAVKLYIAADEKYLELGIDYSLAAQLDLKGGAEAKIPMGLVEIVLVPGVFIDLTPCFLLTFEAEFTMGAFLSGRVGVKVSSEGKTNQTTSPALEIDPPGGEATIYIGISFAPEIFILSDNLASVSIEAKLGAEVKIKQEGGNAINAGTAKSIHACEKCLSISVEGKLEGKIEAKLLNSDKLKLTVNLFDLSCDIAKFTYSFDREYFSWGECPFKFYRVKVKVSNSLGEAVECASVVFDSDLVFQYDDIITDENGEATGYVSAGEWDVRVSCPGYATLTQSSIVSTGENQFNYIFYVGDNVSVKTQSISMGEYHSAAITEDGSLYMWGQNNRGQIGNGTTDNVDTPVKIMDNVVSVSLGAYHSAALTEDGSLYLWGYNDYDQLGYTTYSKNKDGEKISKYPKKVLDGVVSVSLGSHHSAAITRTGDLYAWGYNIYGQIGNGSRGSNETRPCLILNHVGYVELGEYSSAAITLDGSLYTWGYGLNGQLGNDDTNHYYLYPTKIMDNVVKVSMARYTGGAITRDNKLYTWGMNSPNALLGFPSADITVYATPQLVDTDVKDVDMGHQMTAILKTNGDLYMCGSNAYGALGTGSQINYSNPVHTLSNIESISMGAVHGAAVTTSGAMYIWGGNGSNFQLLGRETYEQCMANSFWTICTTPFILMEVSKAAEIDEIVEASNFSLSRNTAKTMTFEGLEANCIYNFYSMETLEDEYPLNSYNLLYITQAVSDEIGRLTVEYIPTRTCSDSKDFVVKFYEAESEGEAEENIRGDIDGDGKITAVDNFKMKLFIKQIVVPTETERAAADINGDSKINAIDIFELKYRLVRGTWLS